MRRHRNLTILLSALALGGSLVTGCGSDADDSGSETSGANPTSESSQPPNPGTVAASIYPMVRSTTPWAVSTNWRPS